jgi:hypothetical protein
MRCAEVRSNLGAYVLGGLEPEEAAEVRRHLAFCSSCQNELEELEGINQPLTAAPPLADPPDNLKDEILSRMREEMRLSSLKKEQTSSKSLPLIFPGIAAAALVCIVGLGTLFGLQVQSSVTTVGLIATPEVLSEGYWGVAKVHPQPSGNQQIELRLNNLDKPEPNSFYEAWFSSGDKYISAGTFTAEGAGETRVWLTAPPEVRDYHTLLITEQSAQDDTTPSKEIYLKGDLP